jgi:chromodomain-helicase-DNA-binding protein 4
MKEADDAEQIILNGKKKMVLDHLVVQQMDKENEEGDIDNMLLHGAAALYDSNEDGFSASDIRYSPQDVEDLIDKVEADAAAEAKEMEERERRKAEGHCS